MEWSVPTYSYRCKACGNEFDIQQSFADDALTVCDECGGQLRKLFNSVGVVFKGSGFYRNDARSTASSTPKVTAAKTSAPANSGTAPAAAS